MEFRRFIIILVANVLVSILFIGGCEKSYAEEKYDPIDSSRLIDQVSVDEIEHFWDHLTKEYSGFLPELKKKSLVEIIKSYGDISLHNIFIGIVQYLFHELVQNGKLLGVLMMLTLFSTILQTMHSVFEGTTVSKVAYFIVYTVLIYLMMNSFFAIFSYVQTTIDTMGSFMIALIPLLLGLLASSGNVITVSIFHPLVIFLIQMNSFIVSKVIIPLLLSAVLLIVVSTLNKDFKVDYLAEFVKTISLGILLGLMSIFVGVMSVQGTVGAVQDGLMIKATKFITGNFIPVFGRVLTEATDTIISASALLKNAVGIVGMLIVILIALFPIVKIFSIALIYRLTAAILQPLGDGPMIHSLHTISQYIFYILGCLLIVTIMFFLAIVIILVSSHITLLLR